MTTHNKHPFDEDELPEDFPHPKPLEFYDALRLLLEPYEPAESLVDADTFYTTAEIVRALDDYFAIPGGIIGKDIKEPILGPDLVDKMHELGFSAKNSGGLQLQWLMKKKTQ